MKIKESMLFTVCLVLLFSCKKDCPKPAAPNIHLAEGLLVYYPFNGNVNDQSGNNINGSLINGSSLTYDENGKALSALNCNGSDQKLLVQNNGKIKLDTAMTISFHAMPRTLNRSNIIGMTENTTGKGTGFVVGPALPANGNLIFSISNNDVACDAIQTSAQVSNIDAGIVLQPESWYHILCVYNKGVMKLYINGELIASRNSKDNTMHACPNAQLLIGGWWNGDSGASFNGKIDEVRLYNRELNSDEIKELAKSFQ